MSERVVRLRPPAMHSRAYPFSRGLISNIEHIYGFSLSRWNEKGRKLLSTESGPWHRQLRDRKEVESPSSRVKTKSYTRRFLLPLSL